MTDVFDGFTRFEFEDGPWTHPVWRIGSGPAVIVIHEIPGLHPGVLAFARDVAAAGMTVLCPSLYGEPGKPASKAYAQQTAGKLIKANAFFCVNREFHIWKAGKSSPIVAWLRALARKAHAECGGKGVGAVGMCFTGGFALAMMTEPSVVAPVLSQPSLPFLDKGRLDASNAEIACAKARFETEDLSMIALRFRTDKLVPDARFKRLDQEFGDRVKLMEFEDADAAPYQDLPPHSVLTLHLDRDHPDGPTMRARDEVIAFFKMRTGA